MGIVKVLLDTHAFLWWIGDNPSLSLPARQMIADAKNTVYISAVSVWEISIKTRTGKLNIFSGDIEGFIEQHIQENAFLSLPLTLSHAAKIHSLSNRHRDPFDQMLIAQSRVEGIPIVTADKTIHSYDVDTIW